MSTLSYILVTFFFTMYATKLWTWMNAYRDDYFLVESSKCNSPDAWFVWHIAAMRRWDQQSYQEAVILWTMARLIHPKEFKINFNIATALKAAGHHKESETFIKLAIDNIPKGQEKMANGLIEEWNKGKMAIIL